MPTLDGPCVDCGTRVEKYVRPGKQLRCLRCAIARSVDMQRRVASGRGAEYERACESGYEFRRQYMRREGPLYERWVGGMRAAAERLNIMEHSEDGTLPGDKPPRRRKPPKE